MIKERIASILNVYRGEIRTKSPMSYSIWQQNRTVMPAGVGSLFRLADPFPIVVKRAKGFVKVRYYGFFSPTARHQLAALRAHLVMGQVDVSHSTTRRAADVSTDSAPLATTDPPRALCPICGHFMLHQAMSAPLERAPPGAAGVTNLLTDYTVWSDRVVGYLCLPHEKAFRDGCSMSPVRLLHTSLPVHTLGPHLLSYAFREHNRQQEQEGTGCCTKDLSLNFQVRVSRAA